MKFKSEVKCYGMKASKGTMENGIAYDSTKAYCVVDMDTSKGNAVGKTVAEYTFGLSTEIEKFRSLTYPFVGEGEFEIVSNGKATKTVLVSLRPLPNQPKAS